MGIADRLSDLELPGHGVRSQGVVLGGGDGLFPITPASAPGEAPHVAQAFDRAWWDGLGLPFAGNGLWAPDAKATLHLNGQKARYRRAVADGDDPAAWINARWREWYPALDRAKSRTGFHALWLVIQWSSREAHRLAVEA